MSFWTKQKLRIAGVPDEQIQRAQMGRDALRRDLGLTKHAVEQRLAEIYPVAIVQVVCAEDY